jgi:ribonuclease Z
MGLVVVSGEGSTLVDCTGGVVHKMARAGLRAEDLRRVVLTHNHVDHVYGVPHLLHALAIGTDLESLTVMAPEQTLETVRAMVTAHDLWGSRYPRLDLQSIDMREGATVVDEERFRITASPAAHGRDTVALRFQSDDAVVCHSSDTRFSDTVTALARDADILMHDCGGLHENRAEFDHSHSSSLEAARVASAAGVGRLVLTHLSADVDEYARELVAEAEAAFDGEVLLAEDGDVYELPEPAGGFR